MFRTELTIAPQERQLARTARVLTAGSCFADSMGARLRLNKVNALVNPFGTVFQPLALAKLLRAAAGEEQDWQQHIVEARGRWQSYDFHGSVGADSPVELLQLIQQQVQQVGDFLRGTDLVALTLGTAWAYRLRETDELVSNLHKLPTDLFEKELLTADEIVNSLAEVHALLRRIKPDIRITLTVSPVRHLKDTLPLNAVSKSVLRVACHYLSELLPGVSYFPAFELLNDDLRDYRFYAADMLHPSEAAEEYIWDRFARAYFDADFGRFRKEWAAVRQSLTHRPLHLGAPEHRTFLDQTAERLERLVGQGVEVRHELRDVQRQLAALPPPRPVRVPESLPEDDGEERIDIGSSELAADRALLPQLERPREEGSRGRNRRGRGRDRDNRAGKPVQTGQADAAELLEAVAAEDVAAVPTEAILVATPIEHAENVVLVDDYSAPTEKEGAPDRKKKRRSRGGAKRTARKHAARLAAEQAPETEATLLVEDDNYAADLEADDEAAPAPLEAAELLLTAPEPEEVDEMSDAPTAPLVSNPIETAITAGEAAELTTIEPLVELGAPTPAPTRKRGTGPTPKKSKVITKSSQVKRPKRTSLFRQAVPERRPDSVSVAEAPEAPIISTPILPDTLLERPVVAELVETPLAAALPAAELAPVAAPAKPRRGRPKKTDLVAATAYTAAASSTAAAAPAENQPVAEPAPSAAATRPARAAKARVATPKSGNPTTTKRGRSPGKRTPPAAETPAT